MDKMILSIFITVIIFIFFTVITIITKFRKIDKMNIILDILAALAIFGAVFFLVTFPSDINKQNYYIGIAQLVAGLFTVVGVYFTIQEEEKIRKTDDLKFESRVNEQMRLANLPVLKFECMDSADKIDRYGQYVDCEEDDEISGKTCTICLNLKIQNVGLGSAQNIYFQKIIGKDNDDSRFGNDNQIIEPKNEGIYGIDFIIPKSNYNKTLIFLVFYEDLLGNKYVQKLSGNISCESERVYVYIDEKYKRIADNYKYEIPQDIIEDEKTKILEEEYNKKIKSEIPDKDKIDELVIEFFKGKKHFHDFVNENVKSVQFNGLGTTNKYKKLKRNIYEVTLIEKVGVTRTKCIKCETNLIINVKTEEVKCISKIVIFNSKLKIKKCETLKLKKKIKKEFKKIKKEEESI